MSKIKNFISNHETEIEVLAYGTMMLVFGIYFGKKIENIAFNKGLENIAKSGVEVKGLYDNEVYIMSIVKAQTN